MERILKIVSDILDTEKLTPDENLQDVGVNSISFVKIIVALEMEYDVEFEDEDLIMRNMATVRSFERRVRELVATKGE